MARADLLRDNARLPMLEQLASIVESSDDAIISKALDGTILSWNSAAARMYGYDAEEVLGRRISIIVPPAQARELTSILEAVARGERVERLETQRMRKDGSVFDVSVTISPVRDRSGTIVGASAITRDISERKVAEQALQARDAALERTLGFLEKAEALSSTGTWMLELNDPPTLFWSKECFRLLDMDRDTEMSVELFFSLVHPDDRDGLNAAMAEALTEHRSYEIEHRIQARDGSFRWLHVWAEPEYEDGTPVRVLGVAQDITERKAADEALRASEQRFRLLAENARDFIFRYVLVPSPRFDYVSPASLAMTGYAPEELYADPSLIDRLVDSEHTATMEDQLAAGGLTEPIDVEVRRRDGTTGWVSQQLTFVRDDDGVVVAVEGISRDITRRKRAEDQLEHQGLHDALTGLANRVLLRDRINLALARAHRLEGLVVAVAFDLDDFTLINDTRGTDTGDAVLREIASRLASAMSANATIARTGNDEFVAVAEVANEDEALALVERMREVSRAPLVTDGGELHVHASIGVTIEASTSSASSLLRDADLALSRAKLQPVPGAVEFFNPDMRARTNARFALISDLHAAIDRDEFELWYQPVVRLDDGRIIGAEALVRWRHPQRGLLSPGEFIGVSEETGHIIELGAWVLRTACARIDAWSRDDPLLAALSVAVNVSARQLQARSAVEELGGIIDDAGIDPGRLTLEMTESVLMDDLDHFRTMLGRLRDLGVRTAVDDFGTGYSSLMHLKHLPFDVLKIDQGFIEHLGTDPYDRAIVSSALAVARAMCLSVVAEGVETAEQLAELRAMQCDAIQGYLVSRPLPADEFRSLVVAGRTW